MAVKFDPSVNLGHVLTFVGFLLAGFTAYGVMDKRVAVLEEARVAQVQLDRRQDEDRTDIKRNNREDIRQINEKLDKLIMAAQGQPFRPR